MDPPRDPHGSLTPIPGRGGVRCRSEGYPRTGYVTPGCVRGGHLAREPVVMSRRRRRRRRLTRPGVIFQIPGPPGGRLPGS